MNPKRQLVYRFYDLPHVKKMDIVTKLNLIEETDKDLKEEERYVLYFRRAEEKGILLELWDAIEWQHGVNPQGNPFMKTDTIPFDINLLVHEGTIVLIGDMDDSDKVRLRCEEIAKIASKTTSWIIDAQKSRLIVGGESVWSKIAQEILFNCHLTYLPSPLAMNLQYDDEYKHKHKYSEFID